MKDSQPFNPFRAPPGYISCGPADVPPDEEWDDGHEDDFEDDDLEDDDPDDEQNNPEFRPDNGEGVYWRCLRCRATWNGPRKCIVCGSLDTCPLRV